MEEKARTEQEWMNYCIDLQNQYKILKRRYNERARQGKIGVISEGGKGNIPILFANGRGLAEAWENSLIALWIKGVFIRTQYDEAYQDKNTKLYSVPPSKDATMVMVVEEPLAEPRIHKDFPGGLEDLEEYNQEVVDGIKNNWVRDSTNPNDQRWEYTYNERVRDYKVPGLEQTIDQFEAMAQALAKSPITRRAQIITWKPWEDIGIHDPPCFQSLWGRILREHPIGKFKFYSDEFTGKPKLNLNMRFRSRDAYEAAFMNDWAFINWGIQLAKRISEIRGEEVVLARFMDLSDSYHIYGQAFESFLERFGRSLYKRHFLPRKGVDNDIHSRTYISTSELVQTSFEAARAQIPLKVAAQNEKYAKGEDLTKESTKLFRDPSSK